jgi:radical SAM superfamily enzyme YgiQ (UPF0313 family)
MKKILYLTDQYSQQRQREKPVWVYPVHMAMEYTADLEAGYDVYWSHGIPEYDYVGLGRQSQPPFNGISYDEVVTKPGRYDFLSLPRPDRVLTNAFDKRYQVYGNYKYHPATHMMSAHGCWHGKCTFCVENKDEYKVRDVRDVISELWMCHLLGFKEVFDDSATFPTGKWLESFCIRKSMDMRLKRIVFGCNLRIEDEPDWAMLKFANFRMVLIGVESANQRTLNRIGKGTKADEIIPFFKRASEQGLEPHCAVMFGYPWESEAEERNTLDLVHYLLRKGYAKTAQASLYSVPGESAINRGYQRRIFEAAYSPEFWVNKFKDIREWADILYLLKGIKKGIIHD